MAVQGAGRTLGAAGTERRDCADYIIPAIATMTAEEACRRLQVLEQDLDQLRSSQSTNSNDRLGKLGQLESELLELANCLQRLEADDDLAAAELATASLRDWRRFVRSLALEDNRAHCDRLLQRLLAEQAETWERIHQRPAIDADDAFQRWIGTTARQSVAMAQGPALAEAVRRLEELRHGLRESFASRCAENPPDESARLRWANELIDRSEVLLTSIEDVPPRAAAAQLTLLADDVSWYLADLETGPGQRRRRLRRKRRRLQAEAQERLLQARLEERFTQAGVVWFERLILALIGFVFALLFLEAAVELSPQAQLWLNLADALACGVFLWEFGVRLALVPDRGRWFLRHFLIDLIPSIPFGLLLGGLYHHGAADAVQLGRATRFLRLRPLVRLLRGLGFLARGLDRLARRLAPVLNRSVILYPTRGERQQAALEDQRLGQRLRKLHAKTQRQWKRLVLSAEAGQRPELAAARLEVFSQLPPAEFVWNADGHAAPPRIAREAPAELVLRRLGSLPAHQAAAELGDETLTRLVRVIRIFARPPLSWLPLVRGVVPRIGPWMSDGDIVALAARRLAATFKQYHDRWFWLADLHGTVTPSVFVDRLGTMLVKSSFRPAWRLALFGGVYLLVILLLKVTPIWFLHDFEQFLRKFVGSALVLMGGVCCVVFGFGWWLKRLGREATEFYERAAEAQFLALTEIIRTRHLQRDAEIFHHRILRPEWRLEADSGGLSPGQQIDCFLQRVRHSLLGNSLSADAPQAFDLLERTVLLYRDSLDGAMFADSDNRTTCQLLGNPAVRQFLALTQRVGRKDARALKLLDLHRQKSLFGGPYLWFNFISRAAAHSVACLIVDYNRHAIPLKELPLAPPANRRRYELWLRSEAATNTIAGEIAAEAGDSAYVTTAFTALHFLDHDAGRDREVEERFGAEVLVRLRRDRSLLIRRIFGTYPWHLAPKEHRMLNLYSLYERWLSGGRALVLPLLLLLGGCRYLLRVAGWICTAVREIRQPELRVDRTAEIEADFVTAVRKIDRMRGPIVHACLRLRGAMDPEYLGAALPGRETTGLEGADVQADLQFLNAEPWIVERVKQERRRAEADMRRLGRLIDEGLLDRLATHLDLPAGSLDNEVHRRAAAVAYLADFRGVRRLLSAEAILEEVFERATMEHPQPTATGWQFRRKRSFRRYWKQRSASDDSSRLAGWWAVGQNLWGAADALDAWDRLGPAAAAEGERLLAEILRHPGRVSEQLVTIRTLQTLSLLDVLNYRRHVYELGQYGQYGDGDRSLLDWHTTGQEVAGASA